MSKERGADNKLHKQKDALAENQSELVAQLPLFADEENAKVEAAEKETLGGAIAGDVGTANAIANFATDKPTHRDAPLTNNQREERMSAPSEEIETSQTLDPQFEPRSELKSTESSFPAIKSFVLRTGPMGTYRRLAIAELAPLYLVPNLIMPTPVTPSLGASPLSPSHELDSFAVTADADNTADGETDLPLFQKLGFERAAPLIVEIGSGMGNTTAQIAAANPDLNYLAIEVHRPGVANLLQLIHSEHLRNLRIVYGDAVVFLDGVVPTSSLAGVHIFFPDPWPKKRHHKRRLVKSSLLPRLARVLIDGGYVHCATDWQEYAWQMALLFSESALFTTDGQIPRPETGPHTRPLTKFERRGISLGHTVSDVIAYKRAAA